MCLNTFVIYFCNGTSHDLLRLKQIQRIVTKKYVALGVIVRYVINRKKKYITAIQKTLRNL